MTTLTVTGSADGVRFDARVTPRASKNAIEGIREGRLVIRVTAPPVDAAANVAVIALLSETLGLAKRQISLVAGERSRTKSIVVTGLTDTQLRERLGRRT
jgi:uncharacterized protein (TIGR00251 family)